MKGKQAVQNFFEAFGSGDTNRLFGLFDDNVKIQAIRPEQRNNSQLYGIYSGKTGVQEFLTNLALYFNTKQFRVEEVVGDEAVAFANGSFVHEVKRTGKDFKSDWALFVRVDNDKIVEYKFYEDSQAFELANQQ